MASVRIDNILRTTDVVRCVIDPEYFMLVDTIVLEQDRTSSCLNFLGARILTSGDIGQDLLSKVLPQVRQIALVLA